jgi:elongation factor 1-alpha
MSSKKPHLNLVIIGHVDHGKSTMTGHLLYLAGAVDQRTMDKYEEESTKIGKGSFKFAWALDKLKEERERGVTIDIAFFKFETQKQVYTIIDAPGHRDFVKNMITGTSQADAAVLVISAEKGGFEAGLSAQGQTREHALLAKTLGVNQLVVAVNKMDTVDYSEERYKEIKDEIGGFLKGIGYKMDEVNFIPVSGIEGHNLKDDLGKTPFYKGPTLLAALDSFIPPDKPTDKPLRLPIQDVYVISGIGTVPSGRVETGIMRPKDKIIFAPSMKTTTVNSIEMHHETIPEAMPGDNVGFSVKGIGKKDIRKGEVVGHEGKTPTVAEEFTAQVMVMRHPTVIAPGYTPVIHIGTNQVATTFMQLVSKTTKGQKTDNPDILKNGDSAIVKMIPVKPTVVESFKEFPQLGRFAVRDMGQTVAVGVVMSIDKIKA